MNHSLFAFAPTEIRVVICFQFVFLQGWITADLYFPLLIDGCDLLSICIFAGMNHSCWPRRWCRPHVVICFQFVFLQGWITASRRSSCWPFVLWFAFNLYFCRDESQQEDPRPLVRERCDLLSICIFAGMNHSSDKAKGNKSSVVICFQFVFLQGWITASRGKLKNKIQLWFAFNLYFCRDESQLQLMRVKQAECCDLLSICIFAGMNHSSRTRRDEFYFVVICFQFVFLQGWITALTDFFTAIVRLWFAFNLYFCRDESQRNLPVPVPEVGCDLLSICIFAGMNHSDVRDSEEHIVVVICFQFVFLQGWITA